MSKKFCPKCDSENVKLIITATAVLGMPQQWRCNKCGYAGFVFPEKEKINKNEERKNKNG